MLSSPALLLLLPLAVAGWVLELTGENFQSVVFDATKNVVVLFHNPGCRPCEELKPLWARLGEHYARATSTSDVVISAVDGNRFMLPGLYLPYTPGIVLFPAGHGEKVVVTLGYSSEWTLHSLIYAINSFAIHRGEAQFESGDEVIESAPEPEGWNSGGVKNLVGSTFHQVAFNDSQFTVVLFYSLRGEDDARVLRWGMNLLLDVTAEFYRHNAQVTVARMNADENSLRGLKTTPLVYNKGSPVEPLPLLLVFPPSGKAAFRQAVRYSVEEGGTISKLFVSFMEALMRRVTPTRRDGKPASFGDEAIVFDHTRSQLRTFDELAERVMKRKFGISVEKGGKNDEDEGKKSAESIREGDKDEL